MVYSKIKLGLKYQVKKINIDYFFLITEVIPFMDIVPIEISTIMLYMKAIRLIILTV